MPGALVTFTACSDAVPPATWAGVRQEGGLVVCADPLPEGVVEGPAVRAWMRAAPRLWVLVYDEPGWSIARWQAGGQAPPAPLADPVSALEGAGGEQLLVLVAAAGALARRVWPAWDAQDCVDECVGGVDLELVAVYGTGDGGLVH